MLAVGVLGFPYIGALKERKAVESVGQVKEAAAVPGLIVDGKVAEANLAENSIYYGSIKYPTLETEKIDALILEAPVAEQEAINNAINAAKEGSGQKALANMAIFPMIMLLAYIGLFLYFKSKGGYKAQAVGDPGTAGEF
jgi:hypothetical protein